MDQSLTITERAPGHFRLCGELDMATARQLTALAELHGPLLLDLSDVSFLDSSGISGLLRLYQRCGVADCSFLVERCSPQVERVLRVVGLYDVLTEDGAERAPATG